MLQTLLGIEELPKLLDATDALAVALCHHFHEGRIQTSGRNEGWKSFIEENPNRLKK
jgi:crossover junction endodeoxyribonuclease RuvC